MLSTLSDVSFIREVQTAVLEHCKEIHDIHYIEHGSDNIVALVNGEYVFRFPRSEWAAKRTVFETALLQELKGKISIVPVPQFIQVHTYPLYTVARYITGKHLPVGDIQKLPEEDQRALGADLAAFAAQLHQTVSSLEVRRLRIESGVEAIEQPWPVRFEQIFISRPLPNQKLRPIVDTFYAAWKQHLTQDANTFTIHETLHPESLLFNCNKLAGIIDFGQVNAGSEAYAFRWLYAMGDVVLTSAIDRFQQLTGQHIEFEHARTWAIIQELALFTELLASQQTELPAFKRSQARLHEWIPNFPI